MLGDLDLATEGANRLGDNSAMRWSAAAPNRAAAAVEEAQFDIALGGHTMKSTVSFINLPGAGDHPTIFV